jgi:uncharacterized phiE125 gp8 family phage protein
MALVLTSAPAVEPVSLAEAKAYLRLDDDDDDALVTTTITVARIFLERALDRVLITQGWTLFMDAWPAQPSLALPLAPLRDVSQVKTYAADDQPTVFASDNYFVDTASAPGRIVLRSAHSWPAPGRPVNGIEIAFTAGYGNASNDVPAPLRQAVLQLVAHWYDRREPVALDATPAEVPAMVATLIAPYRMVRL